MSREEAKEAKGEKSSSSHFATFAASRDTIPLRCWQSPEKPSPARSCSLYQTPRFFWCVRAAMP